MSSMVFGYPMFQCSVTVTHTEIEKISSIENIIFGIVSKVDCNKEGLIAMLPFEEDFAQYIVERLYSLGHFVEDEEGIYSLSEMTKTNFQIEKIRIENKSKLSFLLDPISKKIYPKNSFKSSKRYDQRIDLAESTDISSNYLEKYVSEYNLLSIIDDENESELRFSEEVLSIKLDEEAKYTIIPIEFKHDYTEGKVCTISFSNDQLDLTYELSENILTQLVSANYRMPQYLDLKFKQALQHRDTFIDTLASQMPESPAVNETEDSTNTFQDTYDKVNQQGIEHRIILDKEHKTALLRYIKSAKNELYISSGWIRRSALNNIKSELLSTLARDVDVHLLYGYDSEGNESNGEAINDLVKIQDKYNNLYLHNVDNKWHAKAIIVDDATAVVGSFNWLSNTGNSSKEFSIEMSDEDTVKNIKKGFFGRSISIAKKNAA